jgi:HEPN domain-containing protein
VVDIEKQIDYWRDGSGEDFEVARELVDLGRTRHGLFFAHLALEKMLKAHVCRATGELAPKIHNLLRLAELAKLSISNQQRVILGRFNQYQLEGRYPDKLPKPASKNKAKAALKEGEEILVWLKKQF